jgi:hypothetical protein
MIRLTASWYSEELLCRQRSQGKTKLHFQSIVNLLHSTTAEQLYVKIN